MFSRDSSAVIELPFKLVMAGIIIIITVSVAYSGLDHYSRASTRDRVETAVAGIAAAADNVRTMGVNSSVKAHVDLTGSLFHGIEDFSIGCGAGEEGADCVFIVYRITDGERTRVAVKDHSGHDIPLKGADDKVVLDEGTHSLLLINRPGYVEIGVL